MLELTIEDFHFLEPDFHVVRMIHEAMVVLFVVHLHQAVAQDLVGFLNLPE